MKQETDYPWDGLVKLTVTSEQPLGKELRIRIPGWCKSYTLSVNGNKVDSTTDKGYTVIKEWKTGDLIVLNMDMPVEKYQPTRACGKTRASAPCNADRWSTASKRRTTRKTLPTSH